MKIICAGDCGVDKYTNLGETRPGGISLNVAVHASKLFPKTCSVGVLGAIGTDNAAKIILSTIKKNGLENYLETLPGTTPVQYIENTVDGEKIFTKYDAGVLENYQINKAQALLISESNAVICPIFTQIELFFNSVIEVRTDAIRIADFGSLEDFKKDIFIVKKYIMNIDIALFGLNKEDKQILQEIEKLSTQSNKLFVVTLGNSGSQAFIRGAVISSPSVKVRKVVDTTGAGDAFAAAFLSEYLVHKNILKSLEIGNSYAAKIVQQIGSL